MVPTLEPHVTGREINTVNVASLESTATDTSSEKRVCIHTSLCTFLRSRLPPHFGLRVGCGGIMATEALGL